MKKLPTGVSDFKKLITENHYFVDKSMFMMFIKDVINLPGQIKLLKCPRRSGKTLNMSMIDHFFSASRKGGLFEGFTIWKEKGTVKEYYHKPLVIFVTSKKVKETS